MGAGVGLEGKVVSLLAGCSVDSVLIVDVGTADAVSEFSTVPGKFPVPLVGT